MAVGKNKGLSKGKKGQKKKLVDSMLKKEWYDIKAPSYFNVKNVGKTPVSKSQGTKLAIDGLKGRVFEINLGDLNNDEDQSFRKIKLCCEDVQGKNVLTNFHGMDITRDKLCSLIRKWHTTIEAFVDVKTADGYLLRVFCIAFTRRRPDQIKTTCYMKSSQIRMVRKKMRETIVSEASKVSMKELVKKFIPESIGKEIERTSKNIFPLQNVFLRKVKILKKPKFDVTRLMELHGEGNSDDKGAKMIHPEAVEAQNLLTSEIVEN